MQWFIKFGLLAISLAGVTGCAREQEPSGATPDASGATGAAAEQPRKFLNKPLVAKLFTGDPAAHVFKDRIYVYTSHDLETGVTPDAAGNHFAMRDYYAFSLDKMDGEVTDHGPVLDLADVPWASRQFWAPDAAEKNGKYYLYFPAKDKQDVFRIGVAVSDDPAGPFKARPEPIAGTYSMDPAVFQDGAAHYLYLGGLRGGQPQRWSSGKYVAEDKFPSDDQPALSAKVARLSADMVSLAEPLKDVVIQDEQGKPLTAGDNARRFFEAPWLHKYNGTYYFSYSTGDTHFIAYATGSSPYGPFTYRGKVLEPVQGWTNHHAIVEYRGKWYLFYHDTELSEKTHLRNIKVTELTHLPDGSIETVDAYFE